MDYPDYLKPRFTLRRAADAAAFPVNTLRSNYQRGWFRSFGEGLDVGKGRAQRLCIGDVLVLALASRLIDLGLRPLEAYNAAAPFGFVAHTPKGMPRRMPFQLFDRSQFDSIFIWRRGAPARVIGVPRGGMVPRSDLRLDEEFGEATVVLHLNVIEARVFDRLGLFPEPGDANAREISRSGSAAANEAET